MTLFYPDCSNNNWSSTQDAIDFLEQLVPEGFAGMCHKVSEGDYYEDPYWPPVQRWCRQHDLPLIGYHYVSTDDPAAQVRTWHANNGGPVAMLDWEANGGDLANLIAVVDAVHAGGVIVSLGYYPHWYWQQQGGGQLVGLAKALVSSGYPDGTGFASSIYTDSGSDHGEGWAGYGGVAPAAWQFTNRAHIAGHIVDCNAYRGSDINVLFGTAAAPVPAPAAPDHGGTTVVGPVSRPSPVPPTSAPAASTRQTQLGAAQSTEPAEGSGAMTAGQEVDNDLNGVEGDGQTPLPWRWVRVRARTVLGNLWSLKPFAWTNPKQAATVSTYDQVEGTAEQIAWRYIDRYGNVWDPKTCWLIWIEWMLDGAPTPVSLQQIAQYQQNTMQLRPWPTGFAGAMPGEPTRAYPPFPPPDPAAGS